MDDAIQHRGGEDMISDVELTTPTTRSCQQSPSFTHSFSKKLTLPHHIQAWELEFPKSKVWFEHKDGVFSQAMSGEVI